jgi:hypothetical protein
MNRTWHLPFPWVSDPDGELARRLDAWNADERGGLFHPLVVLLAPDGRELVRHRSRDFADRANDDDVLSALRGLSLTARPVPPEWEPAGIAPQPTDAAFRVQAFGPYFRGIGFNAKALTGRMRDPQDAEELRQTTALARSFLDAWTERRKAAG